MKRKIIRTFLKRRKQALDEPTRRAKAKVRAEKVGHPYNLPCLLYTSPSPRD